MEFEVAPAWPDDGCAAHVLDSGAAPSAAALAETRRWFGAQSNRHDVHSNATAELPRREQGAAVPDRLPAVTVVGMATSVSQPAMTRAPRHSLVMPPDLVSCPITQVRCLWDVPTRASCKAVLWACVVMERHA